MSHSYWQRGEWHTDPWLDEDETLEGEESRDDYQGASQALQVDRGHQAPLASFKGSRYASQVNFMSNITPQRRYLNRGPWMRLEGKVRDIVDKYGKVWVMTGPLYEIPMDDLPGADESHVIPSGYWKIVFVMPSNDLDSIRAASFIFGQDTPSSVAFMDSLTTIDAIEARSGLEFLWILPGPTQNAIKSNTYSEWVRDNFN